MSLYGFHHFYLKRIQLCEIISTKSRLHCATLKYLSGKSRLFSHALLEKLHKIALSHCFE